MRYSGKSQSKFSQNKITLISRGLIENKEGSNALSSWTLCGWIIAYCPDKSLGSYLVLVRKDMAVKPLEKNDKLNQLIYEYLVALGKIEGKSESQIVLPSSKVFSEIRSLLFYTIDTSFTYKLTSENVKWFLYTGEDEKPHIHSLKKELCECDFDRNLFRPSIENFDALCAFIQRIFTNGPTHQYLWIYGKGGTGKTAFVNALIEYIGENLCAKRSLNDISNRFFTSTIHDKRLCVFDEGDPDKVGTNNFKALVSGSNGLCVEYKFKNPEFNHNAKVMYIIVSNDLPDITSDNYNRRRLILCKFPKLDDKFLIHPVELKKAYRENFPKFLSYCMKKNYNGVKNSVGDILSDRALFDSIAFDQEAEWEESFFRVLELDVEGTISQTELRNLIHHVCLGNPRVRNNQMITKVLFALNERLGNPFKHKKVQGIHVWTGLKMRLGGAEGSLNLLPAPPKTIY
jgi:hypothetical protein